MSFYNRIVQNPTLVFLAVVVLTFLSRLARLFNDALFLNGDEAILGIMAQNLLNEGHFPLFFLGQSYGLSTVEVLFITPFIALMGASDLAIKIPMLLLFSLGLFFLFRAMQRRFSLNIAWLVLGLMLVIPSWYLWSMQARGGYLTAFVLYNFLLFYWTERQVGLRFGLVNYGVLVLLFLCQPLWLFALIPFLYWLDVAKLRKVVVAFFFALLSQLLLRSFVGSAYWEASTLQPDAFLPNLLTYFKHLPVAFSGNYWLGDIQYNGLLSFVGICLLCWPLVMVFVNKQVSKNAGLLLLIYLCSSVFLFVYLNAAGPRYLLPIFEVLLLFGITHLNLTSTLARASYLGLAICCLILSARLVSFRPFQYNQAYVNYEQTAMKLVNTLRADGVKGFYSLDPLLQWQLMYYSEQDLIGRWVNSTDRLAALPPHVDSLYYDQSKHVAMVGFLPFGYYKQFHEAYPSKLQKVDDLFFIYQSPQMEDLKKMGFQLNNPGRKP